MRAAHRGRVGDVAVRAAVPVLLLLLVLREEE